MIASPLNDLLEKNLFGEWGGEKLANNKLRG
jgi:hypothetical protein